MCPHLILLLSLFLTPCCCVVLVGNDRLNTILDSDMVLVMDQGRAAEYDTPQNLLSNENSMFYALVQQYNQEHQE